ncbi:MAG: hypothetical protein ACRD0G_17985 [Acidimicrobiales bacterium]
MTLTAATDPRPAPAEALRVEAWADPVLDQLGHDPRSLYCERFWLPLIGPSAMCFARQLADGLEAAPTGFSLSTEEAARGLGLGAKGGRRSPFQRTIRRLAQFRIVHFDERTEVLLTRRRLPPVTRTQLSKLPSPLRTAHDAWRRAESARAGVDLEVLRERSRVLALTLLQVGEPPTDVEQQLHRLRFEPAVARQSMAWALSRFEHEGQEAAE